MDCCSIVISFTLISKVYFFKSFYFVPLTTKLAYWLDYVFSNIKLFFIAFLFPCFYFLQFNLVMLFYFNNSLNFGENEESEGTLKHNIISTTMGRICLNKKN